MSTQRLLLWDVDLTLVNVQGFGTRWYTRALSEVAGRQLEGMPETAGRTERAIAADVLRLHGAPVTAEAVEAMFAALTRAVLDTREELGRGGRALPGAAALLAELAAAEGLTQSVVTGNLPAVARNKLGAFELDRHVDLDIGGFGSDTEHRRELVAEAVAKAEHKHGTTYAEVFVAGDTPHDVTGALACGARPVGVATGGSSAADLRAAGAEVVLDDLTAPEPLLRALSD
ncbi:haloacid dehalogenase-like hydrolase [Salinifilum aidingensis]